MTRRAFCTDVRLGKALRGRRPRSLPWGAPDIRILHDVTEELELHVKLGGAVLDEEKHEMERGQEILMLRPRDPSFRSGCIAWLQHAEGALEGFLILALHGHLRFRRDSYCIPLGILELFILPGCSKRSRARTPHHHCVLQAFPSHCEFFLRTR